MKKDKVLEAINKIGSVDEYPFNEKHKLCFELAKKGLTYSKIAKIMNYSPIHVASTLHNIIYHVNRYDESSGFGLLSGRAANQLAARGIENREQAIKALESGDFHIGLENVGKVCMREIVMWAYGE